MRMPLFLCAALLAVNAVLFLWPNPMQSPPGFRTVKLDINAHLIRLNKEIEQESVNTPLKLNGAVGIKKQKEEPLIVQNGVDLSCYRLGPFMVAANYELAKAVFFNADVEYQATTRQAKRSTVYRVYLGPFANKGLAEDKRVELKQKNILDNFLRKEADGRYIVSLGIYSTQQSVDNALALFKDKLREVKSKKESVLLPKTYWLYFAIDEQSKLRTQLQSTDWGEPSVVLGYYSCIGK